jgi:hypothetical protein
LKLQNLKYAVNKNQRVSNDEITNCFALHIQYGFPNHILVAPDVRMVCVYNNLLLEMRRTLRASKRKICFQYDTTFDLTGYYVSILTMIHPFLEKSSGRGHIQPPVPIAYLFHEKKHQKAHEDFFREMNEMVPELNDNSFFVSYS